MILRGLELLASLLRCVVGVLMFSLAIPVGLQVIARYTGVIPVYLWTEELATFIFVWVVMLGSALAVWEGTHFDVQVIPGAKRWCLGWSRGLRCCSHGTALITPSSGATRRRS